MKNNETSKQIFKSFGAEDTNQRPTAWGKCGLQIHKLLKSNFKTYLTNVNFRKNSFCLQDKHKFNTTLTLDWRTERSYWSLQMFCLISSSFFSLLSHYNISINLPRMKFAKLKQGWKKKGSLPRKAVAIVIVQVIVRIKFLKKKWIVLLLNILAK